MTKRDLALRLYHLLTQAEMLSEGRTQNFDARISGSREHDGPKGPPSTYDELVDRVRWVLEEGEEAIQREKKRQQRKPTQQQKEYHMLVELAGVEYRKAAEQLGMEPTAFYKLRVARGFDGRTGREKAA